MSTREYAKNLFTTWSDEDFCNQPVFDKLLYQVLCGQRAVNSVGIQPINFTRWRKAMRDGDTVPSETAVRAALARMEHRRYVYLDEDTGELLIRSRMRRDDLDKQPTHFLAALRLLAVLDSPKFAWVLAGELDRMDIPAVKGDKAYTQALRDNLAQAYPDAHGHLKALAERYVPEPPDDDTGTTLGDTPSPTLGTTPSGTTGVTSRPAETGPTPGTTPGGTRGPSGSGSVSGSVTSSSTQVGDSRAHTREADPADDGDPEPPRRCKAHRDLPADAEIPPCPHCGNFSRSHTEWEIRERRRRRQAESDAAHAAAAVKAEAIAACTLCGNDGYRNGQVCSHDPAQDAANARGMARVRAALRRDDDPQPEEPTDA